MLTVNAASCTGCGTCELACSMKNTGEFNPDRSRIQVVRLEDDFMRVPSVCVQCYHPPCGEICPTGAITRDKATGIVRVNAALCNGCRMCEDACPFGSIIFSEAEEKAVKCELCDGDPECVRFCPTGALSFKEPALVADEKRKSAAERLIEVYQTR